MGSDLVRHFSRIGARVKVSVVSSDVSIWSRAESRWEPERIRLDICRDRIGEYFEIRTVAEISQELVVLNIEPRSRQLLLLSRQFDRTGRLLAKQKFLCGHEERHWFIAAIPEDEPVSTVASAHAALKPEPVRLREQLLGLSGKKALRRRNAAFVRQGEWFFLPLPNFYIHPQQVLRHEPLTRGNGGTPHMADECFRQGGVKVYVSPDYPAGLTEEEYWSLPENRRNPYSRKMVRNAEVYVRGKISHPDHDTVRLDLWHRVLMNTENRSIAMRFLTFLD